jgi:hypothetical protein
MNETAGVSIVQTTRRVERGLDGLGHRERPVGPNFGAQVGTIDVFHHQKRASLRLVGVEGHHNVRMLQLRQGFNLAFKPPEKCLTGPVAMENLQGDGPLHPAVTRLVDRAHAPAADVVQDDIVPHAQVMKPPRAKSIDLKRGQVAKPHKMPRQGIAVVESGLAGHAFQQGPKSVRTEQATVGEVLLELLAGDGHGQLA